MPLHEIQDFVANSNTLELNGEIFQKIVLAVEYNKNLSIDSHSIQKLLPNLFNVAANQKVNNNINRSNLTLNEDNQRRLQQRSSAQFQLHQRCLQNCITKSNNQQTQTDSIASESLRRVQNNLSGPHSGDFCQLMDKFLGGYSNFLVDTDVLFVRIVYEEKFKFWKKNFIQLSRVLVELEHHMKLKSNQINNTHFYGFCFVSNVMSSRKRK